MRLPFDGCLPRGLPCLPSPPAQPAEEQSQILSDLGIDASPHGHFRRRLREAAQPAPARSMPAVAAATARHQERLCSRLFVALALEQLVAEARGAGAAGSMDGWREMAACGAGCVCSCPCTSATGSLRRALRRLQSPEEQVAADFALRQQDLAALRVGRGVDGGWAQRVQRAAGPCAHCRGLHLAPSPRACPAGVPRLPPPPLLRPRRSSARALLAGRRCLPSGWATTTWRRCCVSSSATSSRDPRWRRVPPWHPRTASCHISAAAAADVLAAMPCSAGGAAGNWRCMARPAPEAAI